VGEAKTEKGKQEIREKKGEVNPSYGEKKKRKGDRIVLGDFI